MGRMTMDGKSGTNPDVNGMVRPIGEGMAPPKNGSLGTTPDGNKGASGNGSAFTSPSGPGNMSQSSGGSGTSPSVGVPRAAVRTSGHHTALPGRTPTNNPGQRPQYFAPAGKTTAPTQNAPKAPQKAATDTNATQRSPIRTSGPSNPTRPAGKGK